MLNEPIGKLSMGRRKFLTAALSGAALATLSMAPFDFLVRSARTVKAIAFDAFPIFDPRPVFSLLEGLYPEKGVEMANVWRTKQFEYSWLRTAAGQYKNFWEVTEDALVYAAHRTGVTLTPGHKKQLMEQYLALNVWPDVIPALEALKEGGFKLSFLSNMTKEMLGSNMRHNKIEGYFDDVISTDAAKTYKPNPVAYQLGVDTLKLRKEEIMFVAFAGWDASGSAWFGYPTFWVNRMGTPTEELNAIPDGIGDTMTDLVDYLKR